MQSGRRTKPHGFACIHNLQLNSEPLPCLTGVTLVVMPSDSHGMPTTPSSIELPSLVSHMLLSLEWLATYA